MVEEHAEEKGRETGVGVAVAAAMGVGVAAAMAVAPHSLVRVVRAAREPVCVRGIG